jgi:hypothetical protein
MSDADPFNLPNLAQIIDTYMHRILDSGENLVDVLLEPMGALTEPPLFEHLWCVGKLYGNFGLLSDKVDAYPVDYGANAETIAAREIRDAARDWLGMPRTSRAWSSTWSSGMRGLKPYQRPTEGEWFGISRNMRRIRHSRTLEPASLDTGRSSKSNIGCAHLPQSACIQPPRDDRM